MLWEIERDLSPSGSYDIAVKFSNVFKGDEHALLFVFAGTTTTSSAGPPPTGPAPPPFSMQPPPAVMQNIIRLAQNAAANVASGQGGLQPQGTQQHSLPAAPPAQLLETLGFWPPGLNINCLDH